MVAYGLNFLILSSWDPNNDQYGALTAIYGTLVSSLLALLIAVPLGIGSAVFITEAILPYGIRKVIGVMVELLAAIPSVVLGLWAIFVMEPALRPILNGIHQTFGWMPFFSTEPMGPGMAPAVLILVVMLLPSSHPSPEIRSIRCQSSSASRRMVWAAVAGSQS
jgi:phosphate transport system permease protein